MQVDQSRRNFNSKFLSRKGDMGCFAEASQYIRKLHERSVSSLEMSPDSGVHGAWHDMGKKKKKTIHFALSRSQSAMEINPDENDDAFAPAQIRPARMMPGQSVRLASGDYFMIPKHANILPDIYVRESGRGKKGGGMSSGPGNFMRFGGKSEPKQTWRDTRDHHQRQIKSAPDWETIIEWKTFLRKHEAEKKKERHTQKRAPDFATVSWLVNRGKFTRAKTDEKMLKELKSVFKFMDVDGGGSVSVDEVSKAMRILGVKLRHQDLSHMITSVSRSGELDFNQFVQFMTSIEKSTGSTNIASALENFPLLVKAHTMRRDITQLIFKVLDVDDGGSLNQREILQAFKQLGLTFTENDIKNAIAKADASGDDEIEFEEFLELLENLSEVEAQRAAADSEEQQQQAQLQELTGYKKRIPTDPLYI